ncbi:MAG: SdiA-regulated domain-containing protein [Chitinophagaceae bacterium]|nr:SdiA-regulated domain-containing protein [Chitinophagaceae bacterium]
MLIRNYSVHIYAAAFFLIFAGCQSNKQKISLPSPQGYDLQNPTVIKLNLALIEISGISFYAKDSTVFAIEDEDGVFSKIYLKNNAQVKNWRFDKAHDYEDLVLFDSTFYVLISNGDIETLQFKGDSMVTNKTKYPGSDKLTNEFESLYYDDSLRQLIMICKDCKDDKKNTVSAWGFNIDSLTYTPGLFSIDASAFKEKLGKEKFKPSAAAINPVTNELYILSSVNKLLVICGRKGNIKEIFNLDPKNFKQPEGITFTPTGDLLISNESADLGPANILIFKRKKKG